MLLQENVPLAPLTTFQVGGPARFFVAADSPAIVQAAVDFANSRQLPLFVLGGGSNLLVADAGWPGIVLKVGVTGVEQVGEDEGRFLFDAGAG